MNPPKFGHYPFETTCDRCSRVGFIEVNTNLCGPCFNGWKKAVAADQRQDWHRDSSGRAA